LNEELVEAEVTGQLDPFYLAAKASSVFVNIHPFLDGNGRTSRLILNAILLRYPGCVAPIGEHNNVRKEYPDIMKGSRAVRLVPANCIITLSRAKSTFRKMVGNLRMK